MTYSAAGACGSCSWYQHPELGKNDVPIFINCTVVLKRGCTFVHGDASARGKGSRRRWDTHAHTHVFLCLLQLPQHLNIQRTRRRRSSSPVGFPAHGGVQRGAESTASWQAGARGDDEPAPQGHPEHFGSRLSQPCQPFKHPAHTH